MKQYHYHLVLINRDSLRRHEMQVWMAPWQFASLRLWLRGNSDLELSEILPDSAPEVRSFLEASRFKTR